MTPAEEKRKGPERYPGVVWRLQLFAICVAVALGLLAWQLWQVQIVRQAEFTEQARDNMVRPQRLESDRGIIYGRNGNIIADNRAATDIVFVPGECPQDAREAVAQRIDSLFNVEAAWLLERAEALQREPFTQITLKPDATRSDLVRVEELNHLLPGVISIARPQRRYHYGETAGAILGYLGEVNQAELEAWSDLGYRMGDVVGKAGIELQYEHLLQGQDGFMMVTKYAAGRPQLRTNRIGLPVVAAYDSLGQPLEELNRRDPEPGQALHLTLDMPLQAFCEQRLRETGSVGAIVVLEADTGAVLAMASNPTYDPSVFVTHGRGRERMALLEDSDRRPMAHRAYRAHYPPGSVYKILVAAAALEEGVVTPETSYYCPGHFQLGGRGHRWRCWRRSGHGNVAMVDALAYSCDVYFYNVGLKLGVDKIAEWSNRFGLGVPTGLDLPGELPGLIPTRAWKAALHADQPVWEQRWYDGETVNLSIGQGDATSTPLQCAVLMASVMNPGRRVRPFLNQAVGPLDTPRLLSDETLRVVQEGLRQCVVDGPPAPTGTGQRAHLEGYDILGKTGTAQTVSLRHIQDYATVEDIPYEKRHHAWFVAGVMDREPNIAIAILIEHGHSGGKAAAPFAAEVISYFYEGDAQRAIMAQAEAEED